MWKQLGIVSSVALISLLLFWSPFLLKIDRFWGIDFGGHGMETIVQNFDGLNYLAVAKTLYDPQLLTQKFVGFANPPIYYAAHFPMFPLLIRALDMFTNGGQALLGATIISNILLSCALYLFFEMMIKDKKLALTLSILALFFPARMLSARGVGTSEPLFMFFVLTSLTMARQGKHWWASIMGSLAVLTRSPGIFLFGAYVLAALIERDQLSLKIKKFAPYLLMPATLALLFAFYGLKFGNYWAFFNASSELHPVFFPPFLIFSNTQRWIADMWREDIIYLYLFYGAGIALYIKQIGVKRGLEKLSGAGYGVVYGLFLLLISHRDLARYALPIAPIALLGYVPALRDINIKWALLLLIPIYLLSWQFVVGNIQVVSDWGPLL